MLFKQFDIDYDKITIDGNVINCPFYLSPVQWISFWDASKEALNHGNLEEVFKTREESAFQHGQESVEDEHKKELEDQQKEFERNITRAIHRIEGLMETHIIKNDDFFVELQDILYEAIPE